MNKSTIATIAERMQEESQGVSKVTCKCLPPDHVIKHLKGMHLHAKIAYMKDGVKIEI